MALFLNRLSSFLGARLRHLRHQAFLTRNMVTLFRHISERHIAIAVTEYTGSHRSLRCLQQFSHLIHLLQRWFCMRHLYY